MPLKFFEIEFVELAKDIFLRADFDYFEIKKELNIDKSKKLKNYLLYLETGKPIKPEDYEEKSNNVHIVVRNIIDGQFDTEKLIYINDEKAESLKKYRITKGDIVIAISSNCGHSFYYDGSSDLNLTLSHYLARFKVDEKFVNPRFLNYYINSKKIRQYFKSVETGKTIKNLSKHYIKELPLRIPSKPIQDQVVAEIEPIEQKIKQLKNQIKPPQEIINKVFEGEFGFDLSKFEELKKIKNYYVDLYVFANNKDIRQSVKFHREAGYFVVSELKKITNKKIKNFISEPIVLGKGISPKDYDDDNGEYYYISMATIKDWYFKAENARRVSVEYSKKNHKKTVQKNDILIARSGEGTIGKVALIDEEIKGIFADFIMRIRLKNYNPLFAYYYFRTEYFQYLIEINKKGLGNNTNIFPSQIQEFPIPDIPLPEQERIVNEIKAELDKQKEIEKEIEKLRNKINNIIEEVIK